MVKIPVPLFVTKYVLLLPVEKVAIEMSRSDNVMIIFFILTYKFKCDSKIGIVTLNGVKSLTVTLPCKIICQLKLTEFYVAKFQCLAIFYWFKIDQIVRHLLIHLFTKFCVANN